MNYLLFDDDCGICTKFARFISRFISLRLLPMHNKYALERGIETIGEQEYWQSFHVLENGRWSTNSDAILSLSRYLPLGRVLHPVVEVPPVLWFLTKILNQMKRKRKMECKADFGASK